jgi:hypothetical protein
MEDPYQYIKSTLTQPDRSLPDNLVEEEEDDTYNKEYEEELLYNQSIIHNKKYLDLNIFEPQKTKELYESTIQKKQKKPEKLPKNIELPKIIKSNIRKFNPRLPLPNLKQELNKKNQFKLNTTDFPTL